MKTSSLASLDRVENPWKKKGGSTNEESSDPKNQDKAEVGDPSALGTDPDADIDADVDTDVDSHDSKDEIEVDDATFVAALPGVQVIRVGVNFEDLGFAQGGDQDYNDAVLCFEGKFKVDGTNVVSTQKQSVSGTTFSSSGCNHKVRVDIVHRDGSKEPAIEFDSRDTSPVLMNFKGGSKMEVFMTPYGNEICSPGVTRNMHQSQHAVVKPDLCNNSGG